MIELARALADAWRIAFITVAAPVIGSVLLLAVARLTGASWEGIERPARFAPVLVAAGAVLGLAQLAIDPPAHLKLWASWWAIGLRAVIAGALLAFAAARLRAREAAAGTTFAAVALAIYALLATPIASDWMLGEKPGHPVSAIGMMLTVEAIGGVSAVMLVAGWGALPARRDMARLMIAAALGLAYLAFMDYLIVWFGNLPSRVDFYLERGTPAMVALLWSALILGLVAPVGLLSLAGERGGRVAGAAVLAGLLLFNSWWVAGGAVACAIVLTAAALCGWWSWRRAAHG